MKQIRQTSFKIILQSMDDRFLKFQGFDPCEFTRAYLDEKMSAIQEEAPYGSTLNATFTKRGDLFKGVITIYSSAGKFFAVASDTKLREVTRKLIERIRKQLGKWKAQRFNRESLKSVLLKNSHKEGGHDSDSVA